MTLTEIRVLLIQADPDIRHYFSTEENRDYTYWEETDLLPFTADGVHVEGWVFYVHRFTRQTEDPVVSALRSLLDNDPRTTYAYTQDYDPETEYSHHIFRCEGL